MASFHPRTAILDSAGGTGAGGCFCSNFMSAWVSWKPHTPHLHTTAVPAIDLATLGCQLFDISLLHSEQIMNEGFPHSWIR